jgi:DNA-binding response OmpR family regulator
MRMALSIAIVEDEANIAMALTHVLRREGFQTGHIEDGADVLGPAARRAAGAGVARCDAAP